MEDSKDVVAAVKLLASSPRFASLRYLSLCFDELGDISIRLLLKSKTLPKSLELRLNENEFDREKYDELLAERFDYDSDW